MKHVHSIVLILSIILISVMGVSAILPILPLLANQFNLSTAQIGLIITAFSLPSTFFTPISGIVADLYGRKKVLVLGLVLFVIGGVACTFAQTFIQLLIFRVIQGTGAAPLSVLYSTLIGDLYEQKDHTKMMALAGATLSIGTAIYPAIGGLLGELHWTFPFWLSLLALPVVLIAILFPYPYSGAQTTFTDYIAASKVFILKPQALGLFSITFLCFSILYGPIVTYFPILAKFKYNASPAQIGSVFSLASLGTSLIAMGLFQLQKHYSHRNLLFIGAGCYGISQVLLLWLPIQTPVLWALMLPIFIMGIAQGITFPLINAHVASLAPNSNRAIVMSINGTSMRLSQSFAPVFFSLGWTLFGWQGPFIFGIFVSCILCIFAYKVFSNVQ